MDLISGYRAFLDAGKTERECIREIIRQAESAGYRDIESVESLKAGDKVYAAKYGKSIALFCIGTEPIEKGMNILGAHIDSPRLDIKMKPVYESDGIVYLDTHYYGGIKKYQWVTLPLALHGVVIKKDGTKVRINVGEDDDMAFCISDLLPHMAQEQMKKTAAEVIPGEDLDIMIGLPEADKDEKEGAKKKILAILKELYGIEEDDFLSAEIEAVPAGKAKLMGFDRSMILAYGQDDRVCAYTSLMAEIEADAPAYTTVSVYADKEEVGSDGVTGMHSDFLEHFIIHLAQMQNVDPLMVLRNSKCLSADVNAAYDPTFRDVMEPRNSCYINRGVVITKYTGSGGKGGTNDTTAEYMAEVTNLLDSKGVFWQTGELGKVDQGGGGTVAKFVSQKNVDTVDVGVPVLSMHSPFELVAKTDVYDTYKAFQAFLNR